MSLISTTIIESELTLSVTIFQLDDEICTTIAAYENTSLRHNIRAEALPVRKTDGTNCDKLENNVLVGVKLRFEDSVGVPSNLKRAGNEFS